MADPLQYMSVSLVNPYVLTEIFSSRIANYKTGPAGGLEMTITQLPHELCEQVQPKDKAPCWSDSDSDPEELTADQNKGTATIQSIRG